MLLRLPARVVVRVDIGEHPGSDVVELNHGLLVHRHEVRGARRKRDEASRRHGSRHSRISLLTHPDTKGPRDHGEGPGPGKRMRRDAVALRQLEPHREETVLVRIPVKHGALYAGRKNSRGWSPLDFRRRHQLVIHRVGHRHAGKTSVHEALLSRWRGRGLASLSRARKSRMITAISGP